MGRDEPKEVAHKKEVNSKSSSRLDFKRYSKVIKSSCRTVKSHKRHNLHYRAEGGGEESNLEKKSASALIHTSKSSH